MYVCMLLHYTYESKFYCTNKFPLFLHVRKIDVGSHGECSTVLALYDGFHFDSIMRVHAFKEVFGMEAPTAAYYHVTHIPGMYCYDNCNYAARVTRSWNKL